MYSFKMCFFKVPNFNKLDQTDIPNKFVLSIEEGYFEYRNFEFENGNFEKQSGELK